ncbi:TPA: hypothetical protein HA246_07390 [Candidatus Woesearchaeota archaeon]|nr:hypothetical protein [Candidatus Woesearchaeota archaeon]
MEPEQNEFKLKYNRHLLIGVPMAAALVLISSALFSIWLMRSPENSQGDSSDKPLPHVTGSYQKSDHNKAETLDDILDMFDRQLNKEFKDYLLASNTDELYKLELGYGQKFRDIPAIGASSFYEGITYLQKKDGSYGLSVSVRDDTFMYNYSFASDSDARVTLDISSFNPHDNTKLPVQIVRVIREPDGSLRNDVVREPLILIGTANEQDRMTFEMMYNLGQRLKNAVRNYVINTGIPLPIHATNSPR